MKTHTRKLLLSLLAILAISANAKEHLLNIPLNDLEITSGNFPGSNVNLPHTWQGGRWVPEIMPYAVSSEAKEIYLLMDQDENRRRWRSQFRPGQTRVIIRTDRLPLKGTLFLPNADGEGLQSVEFRVKKGNSIGELEFHKGRKEYYEQLLARGIPGAAWFRHQADSSAAAMRKLDANVIQCGEPQQTSQSSFQRKSRGHLGSLFRRPSPK